MDELNLKYSDKVTIVIAIIFAALNFLFFILIYKTIASYFMLGELATLGVSALVFVITTIFIAKPILKRLVLVNE
ncbi:hypothetical protein H5185_19115 [Shewanella sp. SG44-6]|jgi:hypothetical protein|uniref:hypothetical protein n=1 Tax=Shewanella sp. SG44-6 TaxID=2760959 RepID=UPI0015FFE3B3|nr:hypothetical protein [Shewanella sp. SG44-6]MBB1391508.1 hypothetical protein [Shewanella sp. SG44-6]|tara:strand:- start:2417 stop:2641 length:225 start_codon:yes stop_codon:yes gene_type:complete